MSRSPRTRRWRLATSLFAAAALTGLTGALTGATAGQAAPAAPSALYIVQLADAPVAAYTGGTSGLKATKPAPGRKINPKAAEVRAYRGHLASRRDAVRQRAGIANNQKVYDYSTVLNGFAARLTAVQAQKLTRTPGVLKVWKSRTVHGDTFTTPKFVGLDGNNGAWKKQFGDATHAGEGVIVGVIDSGFWPENPSFGPLPTPRPDQAAIDAKWHGTCDAGVEAPVTCNNKVIGARWFNAGGLSTANPGEFDSPRDFFGHGSHTASTAAGNHGVNATINGTAVGSLSGMAPAARLAIYKVLYSNAAATQSTGSGADIVAAINQAVEDGVDVINYSVGDDVDAFEAEELAFLNAAAAGVFVSAAAGNAGAGASTVDNAMPWETTVAAGTHDRLASKKVTLGNGQTYTGVGVGPAVPSAPLIDSVNAGAAGADPTEVELCFSGGALDPAKVAGKIVICARGNNDRTDKSQAVKDAGGVGMIMYNPTANSLNADYHFVPTVHLDGAAGAAIKAYAATANPTAALSASVTQSVAAPDVAAFSSRGPSLSSAGDLLKPDIMAPGIDVVAASAPPNHSGNLWDTDSGTSMATPHIAGIAALLIAKHPTWSPMAVKSALMTTATPLDNKGKRIGDQAKSGNATPLDMGAGEVRADDAFNPGLVYDSGPTQWLQYSCAIGVHLQLSDGSDSCDVVDAIDRSDFNSPSLAVGDLAGKQTLTRTVTNTTIRQSRYTAKVVVPNGFKITVSPKSFTMAPGKSVTFKVTITRTTAELGKYFFGSLTWSDPHGHNVRSPIAIRAVPLAVAGEVAGTGTSGSTPLALQSGYAGTLTAAGYGLLPSNVTHLALTPNDNTPFDPDNPQTSGSTGSVPVTVPAGTKVARFATFGSDYPAGTDIDLFVYAKDAGGNLTLVGQSAGGTADETVTLTEPGDYVAFVDLFDAAGATDVLHHQWTVGATNAGNLTVTPASQPVTVGGPAAVTVAWSGLTADRHYLGLVEFGDGSQVVGSTIVAVTS